MSIRILPISVSTQIAAGEVIERPASVIKELLENSIDAKAENIDINIEQYGFKSITIKDDGYGINGDELLLAISPNATSKISVLSDLYSINTFGFRGKALSSIRSISRITLISCHKSNDIGWKIYSEGSQKIIFHPIAHPIGTSVIVENLFYNMPVRLKFLKNKQLEFFKIYDVIKKIALSHFQLNILFKKDKKLLVIYRKINNSNKKIFRLNQVFSKLDINSLLTIKKKIGKIKLFGWITHTLYFLNSLKNVQYCYINNRFVYNKTIYNAVFNAYYEITGVKMYRSFILYVDIPSNQIDINIHPNKSQVRFHKSDEMYIFIYNAILDVLKKNQTQLYDFSFKKNHQQKKYCIQDFYFFYFKLIKKNFFKEQSKLILKNVNNNVFHFGLKSCLKNPFFCSLKLLIIVKKYYGLIYFFNDLSLISLPLAKKIVDQNKLQFYVRNNILPETCSINIRYYVNPTEFKILHQNKLILSKFSFSFVLSKKYIHIKEIPNILKIKNIDLLILNFLSFVFLQNKLTIKKILKWFDDNILIQKKSWNYPEGVLLLLELECFCPFIIKEPPLQLIYKMNIDQALCTLKI